MTKRINTTKIVALLAVLCMITSAFVGSTLAKYTTAADGSDSARVAKFGVNVDVSGLENSAFGTMYTDAIYTGDAAGASVVSTVNVVAPGTNGTLADIKLSGTPEVDVKVDYEGELTLTGWTVDGAEYCPIEITVEGTKYTCTGTIAEFKSTVEAAIKAESVAKYDAGTDLSTVGEDAPSISWNWAFEGNDDKKDTALGDAGSANIEFKVTATVTQLD